MIGLSHPNIYPVQSRHGYKVPQLLAGSPSDLKVWTVSGVGHHQGGACDLGSVRPPTVVVHSGRSPMIQGTLCDLGLGLVVARSAVDLQDVYSILQGRSLVVFKKLISILQGRSLIC